MGSPGGRSAHLSPLWDRVTFTTTLVYDPNYQQRSSDQPFLKMLNKMRVGMPANKGGDFSVPQICRGHRAWAKDHHWPTPDDMKWLWDNHRNTVRLATSRVGAKHVNDTTLEAIFADRDPLGWIDADVESDPENYRADGTLKAWRELRPSRMPVYAGMQVYLTRNRNKEIDFVNGMLAIVESYDALHDGVRVVTSTGKRFTTYKWNDDDLGGV
eukprot:10682563-Karenia_brevis.AAC.1